MPTSTRFLLGGYYGAALVSLFLTLQVGSDSFLPSDAAAQFFLRTQGLELALTLSLLLSSVAILWIHLRPLALAAAAINVFYAVGGVSLLTSRYMTPGEFTRIRSEDVYLFLCVVFVPVVAAISFCNCYLTLAPKNRVERRREPRIGKL